MTTDNKSQRNNSASEPGAAALKYDGKRAPTLVAKGRGKSAEQILKLARKHRVLIHSDPTLLEVLSQLELGEEIPSELYIAVAKVIAFAYYLQGKMPEDYFAQSEQGERANPNEDGSVTYGRDYTNAHLGWQKAALISPKSADSQSANEDKKKLEPPKQNGPS